MDKNIKWAYKTPRKVDHLLEQSAKRDIVMLFVYLLMAAFLMAASSLQAQDKDPYTEGKELYRAKKYEQALIKFREAQTLAQQKGDQQREARVLLWLGRSQEHLKQYDEALQSLYRSLELFRHLNVDQDWVGQVLEEIGDVHWHLRDNEKALEYFRQALAVYQSLNEQKNIKAVQEKIKRIEEKSWWSQWIEWWEEHPWWEEYPVLMLLLTLLVMLLGVLIVGTLFGLLFFTILRKRGVRTIFDVQDVWKEFASEAGLTCRHSPWKTYLALEGIFNEFPIRLWAATRGGAFTDVTIQLPSVILLFMCICVVRNRKCTHFLLLKA